jgi:site-specific DNA-methyltransferase (adenine-specific)
MKKKSIRKYNDGIIKLFNIDCIEGMNKYIADNSIDVVVTSPPYNIGVSYSTYNDKISREEYLDWLEQVIIVTREKLKNDGSLFLNVGSKPIDPWGPFEIATRIKKQLRLQNVIHWVKSIAIENNSYGKEEKCIVGHYKPINSKRFLNDTHEYIFHFTKDNKVSLDRLAIGVPYKDISNVSRWKNGSKKLRCRGNCWYIPYDTIESREKDRPHPASFPAKLAEMCIKLHGFNEHTVVLDPFMGIGNTSFACKNLNIKCIGFEIDKDYINTNIALIKNKLS